MPSMCSFFRRHRLSPRIAVDSCRSKLLLSRNIQQALAKCKVEWSTDAGFQSLATITRDVVNIKMPAMLSSYRYDMFRPAHPTKGGACVISTSPLRANPSFVRCVSPRWRQNTPQIRGASPPAVEIFSSSSPGHRGSSSLLCYVGQGKQWKPAWAARPPVPAEHPI
ncbi:hypothetical protein LY76DRAFT_19563 [Colletotrichum caudatum]|nr:hypothetical protein LY76DRAFT_19563 [Colletotrichum caudatum]